MWVVERLDVDGEELPVIRHAKMWLPAPVALRYALRTRYRIGPAALTNELRAVAILYNWAEATEGVGPFEDFLTSGRLLSVAQLSNLIPHLQLRRYYETRDRNEASADCVAHPPLVCNQTFNTRLFAAGQYLEWAVEPTNHGGNEIFDFDQRAVKIFGMIRQCEKELLPVGESPRQKPLTIDEVLLIRRAIAPDEFGNFPPNVFTKETRYRNWIMFETPMNLGTRKAEMLTLKKIHLPANRDAGHTFLIPRQQDDPEDPRKRRRLRGKTNERRVPLMDPRLLPSILAYRDMSPPLGRNDPRFTTPYLYVTVDGEPIASSTADHIISQIGWYAARLVANDVTLNEYQRAQLKESLLALSWHRLRHTWAEFAALWLLRSKNPLARAILKEWGGWNNEKSMDRYIENAKRMISDEAARQYISSFTKEDLNL
ncbi:MAG: site-specific integrase [Acidobacteria bacterium]|nr:site-specific integrase [Acidobacteriota bacterium]